ncbi:MAG: TolC family protein [Balneolaceae bacterium]|nr:MAG: TolC family protein [Balneolaceae bacterium]
MMKKYRIFLRALLLALILSSVSVVKGQVLTLEEAIFEGLDNNFGILLFRNQSEIASNNVTLGNAGFLPTLSATATHTERIEDSNFETAVDSRSTSGARSSNTNAALNLSWTLFDGLQMFRAYDRLSLLKDVSDTELRLQMEFLVARITAAYNNIIRIEQQIRILLNNIEVSEERISIEETKVDLGAASEYDLLQARSDLNADRAAYIRERNGLISARITFNELLSRSPSEEFEVTEEIMVDRHLDRQNLFSLFLSNNSELSMARMENSLRAIELSEIAGERYPEIIFNSAYSFNRNENAGGFIRFSESTGFSAGVTARFPIFDGFNQNRRIQNAQVNRRSAEITYDARKLQLQAEFEMAYSTYLQSLELIHLEEQNLENAELTLEIALERFRLGTITSLEFREAQRTLLQAENRLISAKFDAKIAETELLQLSGSLNSIFPD